MSYARARLFSLLFLIISFASCSFAQKGNQLSPSAFAKALNVAPEAQLVDVRTPEEYETTHIDKAININWNGDDFESEVNKLDKGQPVYVYCYSGKRSAAAAEKMKAMGFQKVYELKGGIAAWEQAGLLSKPAKADGEE